MSRIKIFSIFIIFSLIVGVGLFFTYQIYRTPEKNLADELKTELQSELSNAPFFDTSAKDDLTARDNTYYSIGEGDGEEFDFLYSRVDANVEISTAISLQKNFFMEGGSKLFVISNEEMKKNDFTKYVLPSDPALKCLENCFVISIYDSLYFLNKRTIYASSFSKEARPYWVVFEKTVENKGIEIYTSQPNFESKKSHFKNQNVDILSIKELEINKGLFEIEIKDTITNTLKKEIIDFKERI
jgi:hypothetical protein